MTRAKALQIVRAIAVSSLVIFSFGAAGEICGNFVDSTADAFGPNYPDNKIEDLKLALDKFGPAQEAKAHPHNTARLPLIVAVIEEKPRALGAWDIKTGHQKWRIAPSISSGLTLGGNLVIFQSSSDVVAHSLTDGSEVWTLDVPAGWEYHGTAVDEGAGVAIISVGIGGETAGAYANGKVVAVDLQTGSTRWSHDSGGGLLGEPAAHNGLAFLPWDRQTISILDTATGTEICRLRAGDFTINFIEAGPSGVYYGSQATEKSQASIFKFDEKSVTGLRAETSQFTPELEPVPGNPAFKRDAFAKAIAGRSASEKIQFHWAPTMGQNAISFLDGNFYLHYWRYIVAFDAATSQVRWSYRSEDDIESVQVVPGGLVAASNQGRAFFIDSNTGTQTWNIDTKETILTAVFDASGFNVPETAKVKIDPLASLKDMIRDKDNRMLPIRAYTAFLMAALPRPQITRDLLEVYSSANIPGALRDTVVAALRKRTAGSKYLVDALQMRYDFLEQTQAPPMNVVSGALVNMNDSSAVPGLLWHLMSHETRIDYLAEIAVAIRELGNASVLGTLQHFLRLYHADASFVGHERVLQEVAAGVLKIDPRNGRNYVLDIRKDGQTLPELRTMLDDLLAGRDPSKLSREDDSSTAASALAAALAAEEQAAREREFLSRLQVRDVFMQNSSLFNICIRDALELRPSLKSLRLNLVIVGESGQVSALSILPDDVEGLAGCFMRTFEKVPFPKFTSLSQNASHTISIENLSAPVKRIGKNRDAGATYDPDAFNGIAIPDEPVEKKEGFDPDEF